MGIDTKRSEGLKGISSYQDLASLQEYLQFDVVIVGSGAGGAVMAYEMARKNKKVLILEAGSYVPSSQFNEIFPDMLEKLYVDHGGQTNSRGDLTVLQGQCVGGSTVVNGCVAFRIPEYILKDWQQQYGLENLTADALATYYERIEEHLSVHENQPHEINPNSRLLQQGAERLGWSVKPLKRNVRQCGLTGHCLSGCKSDRKQSMLVTYLPWALSHGAHLFANTRAEKILTQGNRVIGVEASVVNPQTGKTVNKLSIKANVVVVAAGAIQTPLLFLRSGIGNRSGQIGKNFACHPSSAIIGEFDQDIYCWRGAMLGVYVDEFEHPEKGGFVLEGGGAGPVELGMSTEPGTGFPYLEFMSKAKRYASCVTLIHDHNVGEILAEQGRKKIIYDLIDKDFESMKKAIAAASRIYFAAGARRVYLPTIKSRWADSVEQLDAILDDLNNEPFTLRMVSYHPQGTMRMGSNPANSVVNPYGECHDVKRLFVADASLFPTSILVNPQMTVYSLSGYIADQINSRYADYFVTASHHGSDELSKGAVWSRCS